MNKYLNRLNYQAKTNELIEKVIENRRSKYLEFKLDYYTQDLIEYIEETISYYNRSTDDLTDYQLRYEYIIIDDNVKSYICIDEIINDELDENDFN